MKQYGAMKATEFSRKQIGVIFAKAKAGELKVEKFVMSDFYTMADYYDYDYNGSAEKAEREIKDIIEAVFEKDMDKAQDLIDEYTEHLFNSLGIKAQKAADRELVK